MEKTTFNNDLGFWDYIAIAFYVKFAPKKLSAVGPARATIYALPHGKTFFSSSPRLQELKPLPTSSPLPMPGKLSMAVIEEAIPGASPCTSASPELDDEFEAGIQKRDADELAAAERVRTSPDLVENLNRLVKSLEEGGYAAKDDIQKTAEDLIVARDGVDLIHTPKKE